MTVSQLLATISSAELTEWMAYDEVRAQEAEQMRKQADSGMKPRGFARLRRR